MMAPSNDIIAGSVLGIFAKQPRPSCVKSRLAVETSAEFAAEVADAFLRDAVGRFAGYPARRVIVFDPPEARDWFAELAGNSFALSQQASGDLGARMSAFLGDEFGSGAGFVVLLGTDSPTISPVLIDGAFAELAKSDVVLGPAADGVYYLIGCGGYVPRLFEGIGWGTEHVLTQTVERLTECGLTLSLLPPWYDVDTLSDWRTLRGHIAAMHRAGNDPGLPHTEKLLDTMG
jgi:rSAM/selenodomain-associated transferase 1